MNILNNNMSVNVNIQMLISNELGHQMLITVLSNIRLFFLQYTLYM